MILAALGGLGMAAAGIAGYVMGSKKSEHDFDSDSESDTEITYKREEKCDKERVDRELVRAAQDLQSKREKQELARRRKEEEDIVRRYTNFVIGKRLPLVKKYKFGDMIGAEEFENNGLDISDITSARIVVFGPTGSGKSSFIAMTQHIMLGQPFNAVETQSAAAEGTTALEVYLHDLNFRLLDTRGYFDTGAKFSQEIKNILSGRLKKDEKIERDGNTAKRISERKEGKLSEKGHCLIAILDIDDPRFNLYKSEMEEYRNHFKEEGFSPVSVVTYKTRGVDGHSKMEKTLEAARIFGSSADRTFILRNHIADGDETVSDESMVTVTRILETALIGAEMYVKIQMLQATAYKEDEDSSGLNLQTFLERLQVKYQLKKDEMSELKSVLTNGDIYTLENLKEFWEDVSGKLKWGIEALLRYELENM